jgi:outer membrane protein OmpA-like peptidoglycan-associated protein
MSTPRRKTGVLAPDEEALRRRLAAQAAPAPRAAAGRPLESAVRLPMEAALGYDFARVRVHDGGEAAGSARALGAAAYARGRDVVFGAGRYQPGTPSGRRLIAHELAHVVQQSGGPSASAAGPPAADGLEREAEAAAAHAQGAAVPSPAPPRLSAGGAPAGVQRQAAGPAPDTTLRYTPEMAHGMGSAVLDGFATGSARLTGTHRTRLAALARTLRDLIRQYPHAVVTVTGHADSVGEDDPNQVLGGERAEAVRTALVEAGVPAANLVTESEGESNPRVPDAGAERRNRRVEIDFRPESGVRLAPELEMPSGAPSPEEGAPAPPQAGLPDLFPRLPLPVPEPETPEERLNRMLRTPIPEPPRRPTLNDMVWGPIDRAMDRVDRALAPVLSRIPEAIRPSMRDAARALAERGETMALEAALDAAGIRGEERDAIMAAVRAAVRQAGQSRP